MAHYRYLGDRPAFVQLGHRTVSVEPDALLEVDDDFAATHYFQTGEHGEEALWEPVTVPGKRTKTAAPVATKED